MPNYEIPEKSRWSIRFLTNEYLIEGFIDKEKGKYILDATQEPGDATLVNAVTYRPTGILSVPAKSALPWATIFLQSVIAVIPNDEASLAFAKSHHSKSRIEVATEGLVGPYFIRGTLLKERVEEYGVSFDGMAIDAEISNLNTNAQLTSFKVPFLRFIGGNPYPHLSVPLA